jgi:hypothetical protein
LAACRYLKMAAEPILSNPAIFFDVKTEFEYGYERLAYLITAVRSAAVSDLPKLGKLSVRIDDVFWKKFFAMVEEEAPKMGHRIGKVKSITSLIDFKPLTDDEKRFVSLPSNRTFGQIAFDMYQRWKPRYKV